MGLLGVAFQYVQDKFGLFPRALAAIGDGLFKQGAGFVSVCHQVAVRLIVHVGLGKPGLRLGMSLCSSLFAQGNGAAFVSRVVGGQVEAHVVSQGKDVLRIGVAQGGGFFPPLDCLGCSTRHAIGAVMDFAELVLGGSMVLVGGFFKPD